jgi:hypothetical protein
MSRWRAFAIFVLFATLDVIWATRSLRQAMM